MQINNNAIAYGYGYTQIQLCKIADNQVYDFCGAHKSQDTIILVMATTMSMSMSMSNVYGSIIIESSLHIIVSAIFIYFINRKLFRRNVQNFMDDSAKNCRRNSSPLKRPVRRYQRQSPMDERTNERTGGRTNERTNERTNGT